MAPARPAAPPENDERRQLLMRGGVAAAVVGALLVGLLVWERTAQEPAPTVEPKAAVVPTPAQIRAASGDAAPVAQSAVMVEASAPVPAAVVETPTQSEPASADVAEETRGVAAPEPAPEPVLPHPSRKPASAAAESSGGRVHLQAEATTPAPTPRLVVQTEPAPAGVKPPPGRAFALQAGVFSTPKNAEDLRARLELAGIPAQLETRVVVGPFRTRQDAEQAQSKLKALGLTRGQLVTVKQP
ncbi:SPOR domain-containing protein [Niveibacterium microcysteis]|uniref:SPOR domain-containing protein n=1 Tax=Niveibacterium microcysteis TaxID=2811415 RepID=A0ABX7M2Z3_9RHOO|nr:SPOR domain-containing protein [Niveibacterium microcysteis]QSI76134.1 SPOR domain-containing protein [Niveibacterium microcysteis]